MKKKWIQKLGYLLKTYPKNLFQFKTETFKSAQLALFMAYKKYFRIFHTYQCISGAARQPTNWVINSLMSTFFLSRIKFP